MGMRGNFEEKYSGDSHRGTYLGGVWFPDKTRLPEVFRQGHQRRRRPRKDRSEVFLAAAKLLELSPAECVVFEDAQAGIDAATAGGMRAVGIFRARRARQVRRGVSGA